jgi:hypothetical protein
MDDERRRWFPDELRAAADDTEALAATMQGMTETEVRGTATTAGVELVVGARDGETFPIRAKLDPRRIVVTIEDGRVTATQVG